jgi:hypothetical protein
MTNEQLDHLAQKAFYAAHEAYNINKLKAILYEIRADAFAEAVACCQEVIDDRRDNPEKWVSGNNKTVPKIVAVQCMASGASSCKARIMQKQSAAEAVLKDEQETLARL